MLTVTMFRNYQQAVIVFFSALLDVEADLFLST